MKKGQAIQPPGGKGRGNVDGIGSEPPDYANDTILTDGKAHFFIMQGGSRRPIDKDTLATFGFNPSKALHPLAKILNAIPLGIPIVLNSDWNILQAAPNSGAVLMLKGQRRAIQDRAMLSLLIDQHGPIRTVGAAIQPLPQGAPLPTLANGTLYKGSTDPVYLIQDGMRRWVPDPETFNAMHLNPKAIQAIADSDLELLPLGAQFPSRRDGNLYKGSPDPVFRIEGGVRRWIPNAATFNAMHLDWKAIRVITDPDLNAIPRGADYPITALDPSQIQHVVVVMVENRSFDHLFGYQKEQIPDLEGITQATQNNFVNQGQNGPVHPTPNASWKMLVDPGHELDDVNHQLHSHANPHRFEGTIDNGGFVSTYEKRTRDSGIDAGSVMRCYAPSSIPALSALAREFSVCDHWFASVPGPTLPNRLFVHAGTSLGYAKSPPASFSLSTLLAFPHSLTMAMLKQAAFNLISASLESAGRDLVSSGESLSAVNVIFPGFAVLKIGAGLILEGIGKLFGGGSDDNPDRYLEVVKSIEDNVVNSNRDLAYFLGRGDVLKGVLGPPQKIKYPETIYEKLESTPGGPSHGWRVYFQDFSETQIIPFMRDRLVHELWFNLSDPTHPKPTGAFWNGQTGNFRTFHKFLNDAAVGDLPRFSFVQPRMANVFNIDDMVETVRGAFGLSNAVPSVSSPVTNDGHPPGDIRDMEAFVVKVYDAVRNSPKWKNTMLVIVADEHGGFYDHVPPPSAVNPDGCVYSGQTDLNFSSFIHLPGDPSFDFTSLGVRVPALVISPCIKAGSVNKTVFDHTSIGATLRDLFHLGGEFTHRMAAANPITTGLAWTEFRNDCIANVSRLLSPRSPGWASLGGFGIGSPVVAANQDGRLEIFMRAATGEIHHAWETTPGGAWSNWEALNGMPAGFRAAGTPAIGTNKDGRLEVFVRGEDNSLQHIWQAAPNGGWSTFAWLAGNLKSDPFALTNADGRVEVFYFTDKGLCHRWQNLPDLKWSPEANLDSSRPPSALSGALTSSGQMVLFTDYPSQNPPDDIARNPSDHGLGLAKWQKAGAPGGWTPWAVPNSGNGIQNPVAARTADGRITAVCRKYDASLTVLAQKAGGAVSSPNDFDWTNSPPDGGFKTFVSKANKDGWLEILAFDNDGTLWQTSNNGGSQWSPWNEFGGPFARTPALALDKTGRMVAVVIGNDNNIWVRRQTNPGVW